MGDEVALVGTASLGPPIIDPSQYYKVCIAPTVFSAGLQRQWDTLDNAGKIKSIKERIARPFQPEMKRISKRLGVLSNKKDKTEQDRTEEKELKGRIDALQKQAEEKMNTDKRVVRLKRINEELNLGNHVALSLLQGMDVGAAQFLQNAIAQLDRTSLSAQDSNTVFASSGYGYIPGVTAPSKQGFSGG